MSKIAFSFVIPVYKSVATLPPTYDGIAALMRELDRSYEVIFVDDDGSEESWRAQLELKKRFPDTVRLVKLTRNFGQNGATLCGIGEATGDVVITMDDDLQVHPSEIKKLIDHQQRHGSDVVYGVHEERAESWLRNAGSRFVKTLFNKSEKGSNIGSSIRLINATIASYLRNHSQDHLFINQVISWYTFNTGFVEIARDPRTEGRSGYSFWTLVNIVIRLIFLYSTIPLKLMIGVCIISALASLGLAGYYIYQHFVFGNGLGFLSLIVVAISLILASISVMGIYLNRIYSSRVKKPHYAVKVRL